MRTADIRRDTRETRIQLSLNLDGTGKADIATGVGFLDHSWSCSPGMGFLT